MKPVNKSRSISSTSLSDKSNKIENTEEIDIRKYNSSVSGLSVHVENISSVTPYIKRIRINNKIKITLYISK